MPFILDNSVSSGWFIENQATPYSAAVALRLREDTAWVPALWVMEFTNVLRTACKRRQIIAANAQSIITEIGRLPITIDEQTPAPANLLALALRYDLSSYDAAYLELALRLQLPIATQDALLQEAAGAAGVGVLAV
jgi:predicted nucleic acid-binding protein